MATRKKRSCPHGKVKTGKRKGLCRKRKVTRRKSTSARSCPKGKVKTGPRKGQCRKVRRPRKRS